MTGIEILDHLFMVILVLIALQASVLLFLVLYNFAEKTFEQKYK